MADPTARSIDFRGARIACDIAGAGKPETIVLLHPAFADRRLFAPQLSSFSGRYQVVAIDMPGHGDTATRGTGVTHKDAPEIVLRTLDEIGAADCHLVGVSLGSLIAQAFADRYPERTRSVTVVGGYSVHRWNGAVAKAQRKEAMKWLFYIVFSMRKFRNYVARASCRSEGGREAFLRGARRFGRRSFAAMAGINRLFRPSEVPVPYPLFIVVGEHDLPLVRKAAAQWRALEPGAAYAVVAGAGHCVNVDAPEAFNDKLQRFIRTEEP